MALKSTPKQTKHFVNKLTGDEGKEYVLEEAIIGDVAIVKANQCDTFGNCKWFGSSRNFNPECASAGKFTIVECEEIVPLGLLHSNNIIVYNLHIMYTLCICSGYFKAEDIHLSGSFVDAIVQTNYPKRIERVTTSKRQKSDDKDKDFSKMDERQKKRYRIIKRAAKELEEGIFIFYLIQILYIIIIIVFV